MCEWLWALKERNGKEKLTGKNSKRKLYMGVCMKLLDQLLQDVAVQAETTVPTITHSIQPDLILLENYSMADNGT